MAKARSKFNFASLMAALWLLFSISLAVWWIIFGLNQIDVLKSLSHELSNELVRQQRMLMWEGSVLVLCLLIGGTALLYYIRKERKRNSEIKEFFATFTHELKTSLASLRLQAESLEEDLSESNISSKLLGRLKNDTVRLELQLENSLFLAHADASQMILEEVSLKSAFESVQRHWPDFKIKLQKDSRVIADERALDSILKNLVQNSIVHGRATEMDVAIREEPARTLLEMKDNGKGFFGSQEDLGRLFHRHNSTSGSGVGLYLSQELVKKMNGNLIFMSTENGFTVALELRRVPA